jgi:hypothetical protein
MGAVVRVSEVGRVNFVGLRQLKAEIWLKRAQRAATPHFQDLLEAAMPLLCGVNLVEYCKCSTMSNEDPSGSPKEGRMSRKNEIEE